tara:strand:+ start:495 stop:665 length:171 start_codon:yes stop_codon:yes gene_type:complete
MKRLKKFNCWKKLRGLLEKHLVHKTEFFSFLPWNWGFKIVNYEKMLWEKSPLNIYD